MSAVPPPYSPGRGSVSTRCRPGPSCCFTSEKNFLSGIVNLAVVVVACVALGHPDWFFLKGGCCSTHSLGLRLFFHTGHFTHSPHSATFYIYTTNGHKLDCCVTADIVVLLQVVIGLTFLVVSAALIQTLLDLTAQPDRVLTFLRRNAVGSIVAVWVCVIAMGVTCHVGMLLETHQVNNKPPNTSGSQSSRVVVAFHTGFYLLVLAGWLSVVGVGCSWLRPAYIFQEMESEPLMDDWEGPDTFSLPASPPPSIPYLTDQEPPPPLEGYPPPPYTP